MAFLKIILICKWECGIFRKFILCINEDKIKYFGINFTNINSKVEDWFVKIFLIY